MIHRNREWKREKIADRRFRQRVGEALLARRFRQRVGEALLALLLLFVVGEFVCANLFHYTRYMDADPRGHTVRREEPFIPVVWERFCMRLQEI